MSSDSSMIDLVHLKMNQFHSKAFIEAMKSFIASELSHRLRSRTDGRHASLMVTDCWESTCRIHAQVYATTHAWLPDARIAGSTQSFVHSAVARRSRVPPCYTQHATERAMRRCVGKEEADTVEEIVIDMLIKRTPIPRVLTRTSD